MTLGLPVGPRADEGGRAVVTVRAEMQHASELERPQMSSPLRKPWDSKRRWRMIG